MLKIRLSRTGKRGQPSYRIVVAPARSRREGSPVAMLGTYNPLTNPATVKLDKVKYQAWLAKGAQPTNTIRHLAAKA